MTVAYNGEMHQLTVAPGPEGKADFLAQIRQIYGISADSHVQLSFSCALPGHGEVTLRGSSFDAAVHLASLSAGKRMAEKRQVPEGGPQAAEDDTRGSAGCFQSVKRLFG